MRPRSPEAVITETEMKCTRSNVTAIPSLVLRLDLGLSVFLRSSSDKGAGRYRSSP